MLKRVLEILFMGTWELETSIANPVSENTKSQPLSGD
jgi:hypothetical protein